MGFSKRQQPEFRVLVAAAWKAHSDQEGIAATGKPDESWYRAQLRTATGHESTTDCNGGRDYEKAMAHFEEIAGQSIKWQLRLAGGDAKRILHGLNQLCAAHNVTADYLRRIAAQALGFSRPPELASLSPRELLTVKIAAKQHVTRGVVAQADRDPQISRKTRREKPAQVKAWHAGMEAKLHAHADAAEEAESDSGAEIDIPF